MRILFTKIHNTIIILVLIIAIAWFLRFYHLSQNPPSLTWDEAAWGYNAYSLGLDGKDEFGRFLPITYLESFGDFKPPLYAYLSILPIKVFGLTEFSTRFASAFFGTLTVLLTYFLTKKIFGLNSKSQINDVVALLSAFILAVSPWHILLSRGAFEANVATFFIVLGVYLFFQATSSRGVISETPPRWIFLDTLVFCVSMVSFILSMYTFNTARIVAPLLVICLMTGKRKILLTMQKQIISAFVIGFIVFLPLALFLLTPQAKLRFQEVNIFSDSSVVVRANQEIANDHSTVWSNVLHNRRFAYAFEYLKHYFDNFNPLFLFVKGDGNPKFSIQDVGQMYTWEIPFFLAGILFLVRKKEGRWWIIFYWMIVAVIPAAVARETPHALRIESALPTFQIVTAYGVYQLISNLNSNTLRIQFKYLVIVFWSLAVIFNFSYFYHNYFVHYSREFSGEWQYGYKEAISYVKDVQDRYNAIYFTEELGRPYIYLLFYTQYDPRQFRQQAVIEREVYGFVHIRAFGKYHFAKDLGELSSLEENILYVDIPSKVPQNARVIQILHRLNGEQAFIAYTL